MQEIDRSMEQAPAWGKCSTLITGLMRTWLRESFEGEEFSRSLSAVAETEYDGSRESFTISLANILANERLIDYGLRHSLPFVVRCFPDLYDCASIDDAACIIITHAGHVLIKDMNRNYTAVRGKGSRVLHLDVNDLVQNQIEILSHYELRVETSIAVRACHCLQDALSMSLGSFVWASYCAIACSVVGAVWQKHERWVHWTVAPVQFLLTGISKLTYFTLRAVLYRNGK